MQVIGLISGTSADGIDVVRVTISEADEGLSVSFLAGATIPYQSSLQQQILAVSRGAAISLPELAELDDAIALAFAEAAEQLITPEVALIASHGQTVFHRPRNSTLGYSTQLGRGDLIAHRLGVPTISDFRQGDIAAGGEGAPLVPAVDACLLRHPQQNRCLQNIGGISNVTYLPSTASSADILGWDTGPGNSLLDIAVEHLSGGERHYDKDGAWASQGTPSQELIQRWLMQPFFHQPPPKSTGRELFGWEYYEACYRDACSMNLGPADLLATLSDFTAASIVHSYRAFLPGVPDTVWVCGGGSQNSYLMDCLRQRLGPIPMGTTDALGIPSAYREAMAFAVLGYWRWQGAPGNLPAVTGARCSVLLGMITLPPDHTVSSEHTIPYG